MADSKKKAAAEKFRGNIARSNALHAEYLDDPQQLEKYDRFTKWQLDYLLTFFSDLHAEQGYKAAIDYVMSDLAGVGISRRDRDLQRAAPVITAMLPFKALQAVADAAEINARGLEINLAVFRSLLIDGQLPADISEQTYGAACRAASTFEEARAFIHQTTELGKTLESFVEWKIIGFLLRTMRAPAHAAGYGALQEFLETGYFTFRGIPDLDRFLHEIERRTIEIFCRLYQVNSGATAP